VPFANLYYGSEFNAISEVLRKMLCFAPLTGMLSLAIRLFQPPPRARPVLQGLAFAAAVGVALVIEMLQVLFPPRIPDITDVLLCSLGAALGMWIAVRILKIPASPQSRTRERGGVFRTDGGFWKAELVGISLLMGGLLSTGGAVALWSAGQDGMHKRAPREAETTQNRKASLLDEGASADDFAVKNRARRDADEASEPGTSSQGFEAEASASGSPEAAPVRSSRDGRSSLEEWVQRGTVADWRRATREDKQQMAELIAEWMHPGSSESQRQVWAQRYYEKLDHLSRQSGTEDVRISEWLPLAYAMLVSEQE
jgi:hypothetical protein